jgi:sugar/nucleoside kinase (ribokinase family)
MTHCGLFVGLATVDMQYLVEVFPKRDAKTAAHEFQMATGGPATNAAVTFAHLGGDSRLLARIGNHPLTAFMTGDLSCLGVEVTDVEPESTALPPVSSIVSIPSTGERTIVTHRPPITHPVGHRRIAEALEGVDIILIDGHHMPVALDVAREARRRGITVVLDGGSWKQGMDLLAPLVDIAICSEAFLPPGTEAPLEVLDDLSERGVERCAVTMGGRAIVCREGGSVGEIPVASVAVVDTSGAGDVLHGAFCHAYAVGGNFAGSLERAAGIATRSCRFFGTRAWMGADGAR